ncbi:MAG TPA: Holliday junction resolvase RuvX [Rhodothermales bacterium]|nr:Holliday junction resolvase RuvX [Rhodothermales bacterium]
MPQPRIIAIDYGTKRVGIALADPLRLFAQPYGTFTQQEAVARIQALHADEGIATIVIGWPLMEDGEEGVATQRVQQYINRLRNTLPGVEMVKWDERYTSLMAKEQIYASGGTRKRRADKGRVDAAAAGIILKEYLDSIG